jgi:hypothetical protein
MFMYVMLTQHKSTQHGLANEGVAAQYDGTRIRAHSEGSSECTTHIDKLCLKRASHALALHMQARCGRFFRDH